MVSHPRKIFNENVKNDYYTHSYDNIVIIPIIANGLHEKCDN